MASREHKRAIMREKLQLLRSITKSQAENNRSIIGDASKYIEELKDKVERLNREMASSSSSQPSPLPKKPSKSSISVSSKLGFLARIVFVSKHPVAK
ncbi:hypothetical protein V2J09_012068 [Rumex salicifolius]